MKRLNAERWRVVSPYLDRVLDLPVEARAAWIDSLRTQDALLADDLEALLESHSVLDRAGFLSGNSPPSPPSGALAGLKLGAYTLRSPAGQGGMGSVWLADRSDGRFEGCAAVKLLNASLIGNEGEARFKREGSLLARLRHPHIAHLIDAGMSPMGQPYLVLEHVDGERIDRHCDVLSLSVEARIRLFLDVLDAVAFAHTNLVVHRDIKPSNILVTRGGQVKLLDFGIAKLIESDGGNGEATVLTRDAAAPLTPAYAAPEQLTAGPVTTATDVYALGCVLYVLFTGQQPTGTAASTPVDRIKAILETPPLRPSDAVVATTALSAVALTDLASRRTATPQRLGRQLSGDLDNIVARALKKDPVERYPSVESMADDLRRYLNHQPVLARADSFFYRCAKFARRNRIGVTAGGLVIAAVLAGLAGVAWQTREAGLQRDAAMQQLARATAASEFTSFLLGVAAPAGRPFTVSDLLNEGETLIERQFAGDDALRAEMLAVVGQQYMLSEHWDKATPLLERAAEIAGRVGDPALSARTLCPLALLRIMNGGREEAEAIMSRALTQLPARDEYLLQRAECLTRFSEFGFFTGDGAQMIATATEALELIDRAPFSTLPKRIDAQAALAYGYYLSRQSGKADEAFAQVMAALEAAGRERTVTAADVLNNWGLVFFQGNIARAEPLLLRVLELRRSIEGAESVAPTLTFNYAGVLLRMGRYPEAEALLGQTIVTAAARQERRVQWDAMMELAELHIEVGDLDEAEAQLAKLDPFRADPRFSAFRAAQLAYYTGHLAEARGDLASARSGFEEAVETFERIEAKIALNVLALLGLARTERAVGDPAKAAAIVERAVGLAESFVEPDHPSYLIGLSLAGRGDLQLADGAIDAARVSFRTAWEHLSETLGPDHAAAREARQKADLRSG